MIVPHTARYLYVSKKSYDFIECENIKVFPIDAIAIIKKNKWSLRTYSDLATEKECTLEDICVAFGTDESYTIYNGRNYTIAYNDKKYDKRVLFTLMHEIGHIFLNHFIDFDKTTLRRSDLTLGEYKVLENEANAFARNVLAPSPIVEQLKQLNWKNLVDYFGLSKEAAQTRLSFLHYDKKNLNNLGLTLNTIRRFTNFFDKKVCDTCKYAFVSNDTLFCPICGKTTIKWGDGNLKYTKYLYETDSDGRLTVCPICKNEDIQLGSYCPICGNGLINQCDYYEENYYAQNGCGKILAPNARFCPECGLPSSFFQNKLISSWEEELEEFEKLESENNSGDIIDNWEKIIQQIGGPIRASYRDTVVEPDGNNCLCIVFLDQANFIIGSRPTMLKELKQYIAEQYGKEIHLKARVRGKDEKPQTIYISDDELKKSIIMDISTED